MKILFLARCYYPAVEYGGPIFKMKQMTEVLGRRGHEITVWTTDLLTPTSRIPGAPLEQEIGGARVVYHRSGPGYRWDHVVPGFGRFCHKNLRGFDAMHIFGYRDFLAPIACHYAHQRGTPYLVEPLGSFLPHLRSYKKKWLYDHTLGRLIVRHARFLLATSVQEGEDFLRLGVPAHQTVLRPNGMNLEEFAELPPRGRFRKRAGIPETSSVVLFLGRIQTIKALDRLIEAFSAGPASAHLVIAGPEEEPAYLSALRALAAQLGVDARVHFIGPVYGEEKLEVLTDANLFVLPSDRENFGNAAAEAVACGVPVIVTETCGIAPLIQDRAGLVVGRSPGALSEAMCTILCDSNLRDRFARGCAALRNELSWERVIGIQERIYRSL